MERLKCSRCNQAMGGMIHLNGYICPGCIVICIRDLQDALKEMVEEYETLDTYQANNERPLYKAKEMLEKYKINKGKNGWFK